MSGIEIVGILLAVPGVVHVFFDTGQKIHDKMRADRRMRAYAQDFGKCIIDDGRAQLSRDFELANGVLRDQSTREDDKKRLSRLFEEGLKQLQSMSDLVDIVLGSESLVFWKRSAALRDLRDKIADIRTSMSEFHQLVMSLHTIAISESPFLLEDEDFALTGAEKDYEMLNSTTCLAKGRLSRAFPSTLSVRDRFILESKPYTTHSMRAIKKNLRTLSQRLAAANEGSGILPIIGFRNNPARNEFQLVFGLPSGGRSIETLESAYRRPRPSLNLRIHLCSQLAEAVLQTHTLSLVHKHIRPENVLVSSIDAPVPTTFLCGWQYARNVDSGVTRLVGESLWQRAIYQHPERQSEHVEDEYCMGHDIYSLGVCMLEILTWDPLATTATTDDQQEAVMSPSYRATFEQFETDQGEEERLSDEERLVQDPKAVQRTLLHMTEQLIPTAAGERMEDLVLQCLTCLDGDGNDRKFHVFQEREDKDVAIGFVDTVLKDIRRVMSAI